MVRLAGNWNEFGSTSGVRPCSPGFTDFRSSPGLPPERWGRLAAAAAAGVCKGVLVLYIAYKGVLVLYSAYKGVLVLYSVYKGVLVLYSL